MLIKTPLIAALASAALLAGPALAQTPQTSPGAPASAVDPLYLALGEKPGIAKLMDQFVDRLRADARIGKMFMKVKPAHLKKELTDQICVVSGGPCVYDGEEMKNSHADQKIERSHFNALVEVLQDTMDAQGVGFTAQRQLLARLAPMHRDIITVH